jgi:hypothetical protein
MLGPLLARHGQHEGAKNLEHLFVFLTQGLDFDAYRDVLFSLLAYTESLSTSSIGDFQSRCFINPYAPGSVFNGPLLEQFLSNMSLDIAEVPQLVGGMQDERELLLDTLFFRKYPVWRVGPERYLCFDPYLLAEKLSTGVYWAIQNALGSDGSATASHIAAGGDGGRTKRTLDFSGLWGLLTEDYVCEVLRYAVGYEAGSPAGRGPHVIEKPFYTCCSEEAFDAVLLDGQDAVVFQVKKASLTWPERYSGRGELFFDAVDKIFGFGHQAACEQLLRNIRHTFALGHRRTIAQVPTAPIRCVWPVVVFLDPIFDLGLATWPLASRFQEVVAEILPPLDVSFRSVVFMQLEDLELIAENVRCGDFSLVECLRAKLAEDREHKQSFGEFYWGVFAPRRDIPFRRNAAIKARYEAVAGQCLERLGSEYADSLQTPFGVVRRRSTFARP